MADHRLVQNLHAAISRRNWHDTEVAANAIRDNKNIKWPPLIERSEEWWLERARTEPDADPSIGRPLLDRER